MKTIHTLTLAALFSAALSAGCASTAPPAPAGDPHAQNIPNILIEPALQPWVVVGNVTVDKASTMRITANVRLASNSNGTAIQYKFTFFDASGRPLPSQTDWKSQTLEPRMPRILTGDALDTGAADWRLEIRPARGGAH